MKHTILTQHSQGTSEEDVTIELIAENQTERQAIANVNDDVQNYLSLNLQVLEVISSSSPVFRVRKVKDSLGFGGN